MSKPAVSSQSEAPIATTVDSRGTANADKLPCRRSESIEHALHLDAPIENNGVNSAAPLMPLRSPCPR